MLVSSTGLAELRAQDLHSPCEDELSSPLPTTVIEFTNALKVYLKTLGPKSEMAASRIIMASTPVNPVANVISSSDVQFQNFFARRLPRLTKAHWVLIQESARSWSIAKVEIENVEATKREETAEIAGLHIVDVSALSYEKTVQQVTVGNTSYLIARESRSNNIQLIKIDLTNGKQEAAPNFTSNAESKGVPAIFVGRDEMVYVALPENSTIRLFVTGPEIGLVPLDTFKTLRYGFHAAASKLPNGKTILSVRSGAYVEFYEFNESKRKFQFRGEVQSQSVSRAESDFFEIDNRTYFISQKHNRSFALYEFPEYGVVKEVAPLPIKRKDKKDLLLDHAHSFILDGNVHVAFYTGRNDMGYASVLHVVNFGKSVSKKRIRLYTKIVVDATIKNFDVRIEPYSNLLVVQKAGHTFIISSEANHIEVHRFNANGTLDLVNQLETGPTPMYLQAWRDANDRDLIGAVDEDKLGYYELSTSGDLTVVDTYTNLKRFRGFHGPLFLQGKEKTFIAFGNEELMTFATKKLVKK